MTVLKITIYHEPDLDEVGLWCEACALPSAIRLHFVGMSELGIGEMATRTVCTGCNPELFEDD